MLEHDDVRVDAPRAPAQLASRPGRALSVSARPVWWNGGMMELDGRPVTADELAGLALYNFGHFTSMRVDNGRVRGLSLHLRRLVNDCQTLFAADLDPEMVRKLVRRVCGDSSVIARVTVFAPDLELNRPGRAVEPHVLVTTRPAPEHPLPPLRLQSASYERDLPAVKHVGLFGTMWQRRAAQLGGFDDVLFLDDRSRISEGATWNIGFYDGERLVWPRSEYLPGVTMALVKSLGRPESTIADLDLATVATMRAAFVTNAGVGVRPVSLIDEVRYADDEETLRELSEAYLAIRGEDL